MFLYKLEATLELLHRCCLVVHPQVLYTGLSCWFWCCLGSKALKLELLSIGPLWSRLLGF